MKKEMWEHRHAPSQVTLGWVTSWDVLFVKRTLIIELRYNIKHFCAHSPLLYMLFSSQTLPTNPEKPNFIQLMVRLVWSPVALTFGETKMLHEPVRKSATEPNM